MTSAPVLLSVNVGLPKDVAWQGKTVHTGIWKSPVAGPVQARRLNLDGDGQGDLNGHGGEQRAVLVYQIQSYRHWQQHFGRDDFGYGQFGENLTVDGLPDDEVCIGDRYRIGAAEFEVTQPRVTCYRVGLRLGQPQMAALLVSHHRPGFYMRVIREGPIEAGQPIVKTRTGPHALTVTDTDALLYLPGRDLGKLKQAVQIPALSPGWQQSFNDLLAGRRNAGRRADAGHRANPTAPARLVRLPLAAGGPGGPGDRGGVLDLPGRPGRRRAAAGQARPVPDVAGRSRPASPPRCAATRCPPCRTPPATGSASSTSHTAPPAAT